MSLHKAFDGLVTFEISGDNNLKMVLVEEALKRAVPEVVAVDGQSATIVDHFISFLGRTRNITFETNEGSEAMQEVIAFWFIASNTTDYRRIWDAYGYLSAEAHNEWYRAIEAQDALRSRLLAPSDVQPGAPSDEALAAADADAPPNKKKGSTSETPSSPK